MTGPEYFSLEALGRPMLVIGRSYFYPRGLPLNTCHIYIFEHLLAASWPSGVPSTETASTYVSVCIV